MAGSDNQYFAKVKSDSALFVPSVRGGLFKKELNCYKEFSASFLGCLKIELYTIYYIKHHNFYFFSITG